MINQLKFITTFFLLSLSLLAQAEPYQAKHLQVQLVSEYEAIKPDGSQYLALRFIPEEDWHIYWKFHGDSGLAPSIKWQTTNDITFHEIEWPIPERIQVGHLMNYGYSSETFLPIQITTSKNLAPGSSVKIQAEVSWLVCKEECIPGEALLDLTLPVDNTAALSKWAEKISAAIDDTPLKLDLANISARTSNQSEIIIDIEALPGTKLAAKGYSFFPYSAGQIDNFAEQTVAETQAGIAILLSKPKNRQFPEELSGILVSESGWTDNKKQALDISAKVAGVTDIPPNLGQAATSSETANPTALWLTLLGAFIGGLILNLMPCVFPILSIKILGFIQQGNQPEADKKSPLQHALSFASGVIISFWVLAGVLIALKSAGNAIGWGFQLQSPTFVLAMIFLMFTIALNLYGFFDFGSRIQNIAGRQSHKHGLSGSFFSGVLATALATPCTAPFMASALAVALSAPLFISFLIFTSLALGMALPYVILSSSPALLKKLPKPGAWMEKLKQFLSFPLFATAIWLFSVYATQTNAKSSIYLLFGLLLFTFAIWCLNNFSTRSVKAAALVMIASSFFISLPVNEIQEQKWEVFSQAKLQELLADNRPVFIDFTAEWCLTCKLNKFSVLTSNSVISAFAKKDVTLLVADWTKLDADITRAIEGYGRSGVPLNVLYYGEKDKHHIFPSLLTKSMVIEEINKIGE